jgi:hypothetical protein
VLVYSILNHGRVTHRPGLYKAWVSLQGYLLISSIKCSFGCSTIFSPATVQSFMGENNMRSEASLESVAWQLNEVYALATALERFLTHRQLPLE